MLQPTSPIRKVVYFKEAFKEIFKNDFDSMWSVSLTNLKNHPDKQLLINNNKLSFFPG